eukprot:TRINITY_DN9800_c0_g1_i4.p1 TRINITY_DN9800_c0_g1~~TRINITY_DN9800_c0_g1_i4.p1  ORF type:complete len:271 (-),score=64.30 TRINITY_DN9800_c0_g1_i4:297-1109(-)
MFVSLMCALISYYLVFFFFFKQKTAYEMLRSLVGSEMCIRDRQRAAQPKIAKHPKPLVAGSTSLELFAKVEPNQGEYMSGAKLAMLTVPDRSLAHLRHPTWYAGRAVCEMFKKPSLDLMGPDHPVKEHILNLVAKNAKEVALKGPTVGPKGAKERLEWKEREDAKARNGRGPMPAWIQCCVANKEFNPLQLSKGNYIVEKKLELARVPDRCDPKKPQIKTLGKPGYFENDLRLINTDVRGDPRAGQGWPMGDTIDYMSLAATKRKKPIQL